MRITVDGRGLMKEKRLHFLPQRVSRLAWAGWCVQGGLFPHSFVQHHPSFHSLHAPLLKLKSTCFMPNMPSSAVSQHHLPDTKSFPQPLPIAGPTGLTLNIQQTSCAVSVFISWNCCHKVPRLGALKQQKGILSKYWRLEIRSQSWQDHIPSKGESFLASSIF